MAIMPGVDSCDIDNLLEEYRIKPMFGHASSAKIGLVIICQ